jgi:hypothetical protein
MPECRVVLYREQTSVALGRHGVDFYLQLSLAKPVITFQTLLFLFLLSYRFHSAVLH